MPTEVTAQTREYSHTCEPIDRRTTLRGVQTNKDDIRWSTDEAVRATSYPWRFCPYCGEPLQFDQ